ncbi:MAG: hypothetical protein ACTSYD_02160 [Candidatus Heimdallarchaeaceae archaeon]
MEEKQEKKFGRKRTILASLFALFLVSGVVFAAYTVLTTTIEIEVREPFEIYYAVLGDPSFPTVSTCAEFDALQNAPWVPATQGTINAGYFYPGEERKICVKVVNKSSADLEYSFSYGGTGWGQADRTEHLNSPAPGNGYSISRIDVVVHDDAAPGNYEPTITVLRG